MFSDLEKQALDEAGRLQDEWELNECNLHYCGRSRRVSSMTEMNLSLISVRMSISV